MPTTVLLQSIQASMEASDFNYRFADPTPLGPSTAGILPHESLPLSLLGLVNRGRPHPTLDEVRLRTEPAHNLTVGMLINEPSLHAKFANAALCVESGRLVLHLCKFCVFIVTQIANLFKGILPRTRYTFQVPEQGNRVHRCLSQRIYSQFPQDSLRPRERSSDLFDDYDTSGGEEDNPDPPPSDDEMSEVAFSLVSLSSFQSTAHILI
jgi:hypothetical protein